VTAARRLGVGKGKNAAMEGVIGDKLTESTFYAQIGSEGMQHSLGKPFADGLRAQILLEFGAALSLMPAPPARVIDFGCGTGWTTDFLARSGYEATGVDLSPEAITAASKTYAGNGARYLHHDYELPLDDAGTYDIALFFDALHHCADVEAALATAARALRPGGICLVVEPGRGHSESPASLDARERYGVIERDMPPKVVLAAARKAGFRGGKVHPYPAEVQHLLYRAPASARTGARRVLDTRPGRWLMMIRAMDFNRSRGGLVRLER
jgi:SAM-dependent methyltransferase